MQGLERKKGWTRTFTEDHLQKLRNSHTGITYPNRKPMSEEQKEKLREAARKNWERRIQQTKGSNHPNSLSVPGYGLMSLNEYVPSNTLPCSCGRMYLEKLGCVFCK